MKNSFPYQSYRHFFSERLFFRKMSRYFRTAGQKTVHSALLLYYAYRRKETPQWAKNVILGVLGYFLAPIDALPDISPFVGYTDDLGVLTLGLATIACYINDEVRRSADAKSAEWFGISQGTDRKGNNG
ncbi:MAG: hypothetical protein RLY31_2383 [Bacteroidota bacterium]|jgi:uncharacterized membrane protein YkvA (DUF1232 family)